MSARLWAWILPVYLKINLSPFYILIFLQKIRLRTGNERRLPNARHQARQTGGARDERSLFAVACMPLFGWVCSAVWHATCHMPGGETALSSYQEVPVWRRICSTSRCSTGILLITTSQTMS